MPELRSRYRGCLLAGAVGDALGADIEFWPHSRIVDRFGPGGPMDLGAGYGVAGAITDDTQMTLWTAEGSLRAYRRGATKGIVSVPGMALQAYLRWLDTQEESPDPARHRDSWLWAVDALHARRAPGMTCLSALRSSRESSSLEASNDSKGCGGVMRMAPVGLLSRTPDIAFDIGCKLSALTHGHPTGIVAAGAFAVAVWHLAEGADLEDALDHAHAAALEADGGDETAAALEAARRGAESDLEDAAAVHALGTVTPGNGPGWVAEEALAVAALCARRYPTDMDHALRASVTHTGDSDSTGAICGNLLGAYLGLEATPSRWADAIELRGVILQVADDLHDARVEGVGSDRAPSAWTERYPPG